MGDIIVHLTIEEIIIPFEKSLMDRWRMRDPLIVPLQSLEKGGRGVERSYGFGEFLASQYFREKGYNVIDNGYNLISKTSKFKENNKLIELVLSKDKISQFKTMVNFHKDKGYKITTDLDLFIYNSNVSYFVDAKKGKDTLGDNQINFMYLAKEVFDIDSKVAYLDNKVKEVCVRQAVYKVNLS
jgi:hypothetical protein